MQVKESLKVFSVLLFITLVGRADSKQVRNIYIILYDILNHKWLTYPLRLVDYSTMLVEMSALRAIHWPSKGSGKVTGVCFDSGWITCQLVTLPYCSYNAKAPDAFIYVGTKGRPENAGTDGVMVPYPAGTTGPLKAYNGQYYHLLCFVKHPFPFLWRRPEKSFQKLFPSQ